MDRAIELTTEYTVVTGAVRYNGDDGIDEQKHALRALYSRCSTRGVNITTSIQASHTAAMEEKCSTLSSKEEEESVQGRGARIRHGSFNGKAYMSVDDFTAYFTQSRATTGSHELQAVTEQTNDSVPAIESGKHNRRSTAMMVVGQLAKEWLCPDDRALRRTKERVHFPLATIATFIIIAISLMLMVSGSVMVAGAKKQVSDLRREVNDLSAEAAVLEDKLEAGVDYFEVYRIATEEYGMVDAGYVSASYLNGDTENRLEAHAVQEDNTTGLATLLAAIGIRSGK